MVSAEVKSAVGLPAITMVLTAVSVQLLYVLVKVTVYVPVVLYDFTGLAAVDVVPSPKSQSCDCAAGAEVLVKLTDSFIQAMSVTLNDVTLLLITTALFLTSVSEQPRLLVTVSITVKEPVLL